MRTVFLGVAAAFLIVGCATYRISYRINSVAAANPREAAGVLTAECNAALASQFRGSDPPPQMIYAVAAVMPPEAIDRKIEGDVLVRFMVDEEGRVATLEILRSPHELLSAAVEDAIRQWQFSPMKRDGKPVAFSVQQTVKFVVQ